MPVKPQPNIAYMDSSFNNNAKCVGLIIFSLSSSTILAAKLPSNFCNALPFWVM